MNPFHAWLWRMQRKGYSLDDLSEMTGLSRDKINRYIKDHRWDRGEVVMSAKQLTQAYVVEGKSIREIADQFFCTYSAVYRHLEKYNIQRRPRYVIQKLQMRDNGEEQRITANDVE